jgi:hypothetical protein
MTARSRRRGRCFEGDHDSEQGPEQCQNREQAATGTAPADAVVCTTKRARRDGKRIGFALPLQRVIWHGERLHGCLRHGEKLHGRLWLQGTLHVDIWGGARWLSGIDMPVLDLARRLKLQSRHGVPQLVGMAVGGGRAGEIAEGREHQTQPECALRIAALTGAVIGGERAIGIPVLLK